jgi:N-carbamoylputrescine amidase
MRKVTVATSQMSCEWNIAKNIDHAEAIVREAAGKGAQIVLLQELFETPYFCIEQNHEHLELATTLEDNLAVARMQQLAAELEVVLPVSFFERASSAHFNTVAMIDADGTILGRYRKSHIPNDVGYQEKSYFSPGDTGFKVWDTRYAKLGVGICWDQWFPEAARCMALQGAEMLLYPTAIGSEPAGYDSSFDSATHWQNAMCGHAAANIMPVIAANRIGTEAATLNPSVTLDFYGSSFIAGHTGTKVIEADRREQSVLCHTFDLDEIAHHRKVWGVYRDRRPDLYGAIMTLDGST